MRELANELAAVRLVPLMQLTDSLHWLLSKVAAQQTQPSEEGADTVN